MSTTTDQRKTTLGIINEVLRRLGVSEVSSLDGTKLSRMLLELLNDTVDEISDFSDWPEMYEEVDVTALASVGTYKIQSPTSARTIKNVYEIVYGDDVPSLEVRTIEDIRRLQRLASFGVPRQFAIVGVSGINPLFRVYPIPNQSAIDSQTSAGGVFNCAIYVKPVAYTTAAASAEVPFNARMVQQGLYAKALLEENGDRNFSKRPSPTGAS